MNSEKILWLLQLFLFEAFDAFRHLPKLTLAVIKKEFHEWRHFFNFEEMSKYRCFTWSEKPAGHIFPFTVCMMCTDGHFHYIRPGFEAKAYLWRQKLSENLRASKPWWEDMRSL